MVLDGPVDQHPSRNLDLAQGSPKRLGHIGGGVERG
jgi:hypothetical protein